MRLILSTSDYMNTTISDERGRTCYTIFTPPAFKKVTTITKYHWSGPSGVPETMGVIEWHQLTDTLFQFNGRETPADVMLEKRTWSTGRHFMGPDHRAYKWKLESTHCWMKSVESSAQLVRFHRENLGFSKPAHPGYLDVSDSVVPMLDHVILTFVYIVQIRGNRRSRRTQLWR